MAELIKNKGYLKKGVALFGLTGTASGPFAQYAPYPIFTTETYNDSDSIVKLSTTQIKLLAGKKYKLTGSVVVMVNAADEHNLQFYDVTASAYIGTIGKGLAVSYSSANLAYDSNEAVAFISTTVDTTIELRHIYSVSTLDVRAGSKVIVEEVEAYLQIIPINTFPVNGVQTEIKTKYLIGTLDNDGETSIAHGVTDYQKILSINITCFDSGVSWYIAMESQFIDDAIRGLRCSYNATNITIQNGSVFNSQNYRIKIEYYI